MTLKAKRKNYEPRKTNMEPNNEGLEDESPFEGSDFQIPAVSFLQSSR